MTADKIVEVYNRTGSIRETAASCGVSPQKARRILQEAGEYTSPTAEKVGELHEAGRSVAEIAEELNIGEKAVQSYLPYSKGAYMTDAPTKNALAIRKHRASGKAGKEE